MRMFFQGLQMHKSAYFNILLPEKSRGKDCLHVYFCGSVSQKLWFGFVVVSKGEGRSRKKKTSKVHDETLEVFCLCVFFFDLLG